MKAPINEIFSSIQGEGILIGHRQIFLRFSGCDLNCEYCDTPHNNYTEISLEEIVRLILNLETEIKHQAISFTGGEPLLYNDFIKELILILKQKTELKFYLETGGHRPDKLIDIINYIDYVSFDLKLPSILKSKDLWEEHKEFIKIINNANKASYAKIVIEEKSTYEEIIKACKLLENYNNIELVLQPVYSNYPCPLSHILKIEKLCSEILGRARIRVIPQIHRILGIR